MQGIYEGILVSMVPFLFPFLYMSLLPLLPLSLPLLSGMFHRHVAFHFSPSLDEFFDLPVPSKPMPAILWFGTISAY